MIDTEVNDDLIIKEILSGSEEQYALLMKKYNQRLYRISKGYIKKEEEIEDIMQETYIKAFQNLGKFEHRSTFSSWLTRILINECLQYIRRASVKPSFETIEINTIKMTPVNFQTPETKTLNKELKQILERNIDSLPEKYKLVFLMREVEKINIEETSEVLGISIANVKIRSNRAKEMLRRSLMETYPLNEVYEFNLVRCSRVAAYVMSRI